MITKLSVIDRLQLGLLWLPKNIPDRVRYSKKQIALLGGSFYQQCPLQTWCDLGTHKLMRELERSMYA